MGAIESSCNWNYWIWNDWFLLAFTMLMRTDPSNTAAPVLGSTFGTSSMQPIKSDLFPEHIWPNFDKEGGCRNVLWLKNSFVSQPLIWVAIYICENNLTCILSSFVKHFKDCPFVFPALKRGKLFFFIGVSRVTVWWMSLESWNSWNCFLPSEHRLLTAHKSSSLYLYIIIITHYIFGSKLVQLFSVIFQKWIA